MLPYNHSIPALPVASPSPEVSRIKLKELAHWIRDELDVRIAREGPNVLQPDDVVTLHELFVALRRSTTITALDLRATGIHTAVKNIAGIATRWPGRLCDDCDKIIVLWRKRFGPLDELHPFLYGRGGRLAGIASRAEYSREALLKRWSQYCPDKIDPKVSHRQGSLGFTAGDWWISPLFAHHAGIIGLESIEGGTTCDKDGAYALVLKNISEVDARDADCLTYRFQNNDRGRFRLTAATVRSREPIRVLRSHCATGSWGPKAGIRYEGLYSVKGWCIRQAKLNDSLTGEHKEGDILYEIRLQRHDPVPMDEVIRRPTNVEIDDYAEYKRLRKHHRANKHNEVATFLTPLQTPVSSTTPPQSLLRMSPSISRTATFKELVFDGPRASHDLQVVPTTDVISPMTRPANEDSFFARMRATDHIMPQTSSSNSTWLSSTSDGKHAGDFLISIPQSIKDNLWEIIPWHQLDDAVPAVDTTDFATAEDQQSGSRTTSRSEMRATEIGPIKDVRRLARDTTWQSHVTSQVQEVGEEDTVTNAMNLRLPATRSGRRRAKAKDEQMHNVFGKKHSSFDGAGLGADEAVNTSLVCPLKARCFRSSTVEGLSRRGSSTPVRLPEPNSLQDHGIEDIEFPSPLDNLISYPRMASPVNSFVSSPMISPPHGHIAGESIVLGKLKRWLSK